MLCAGLLTSMEEAKARVQTLICCALPAGVLFTRINVDTFPVVATAAATELQQALQVCLHPILPEPVLQTSLLQIQHNNVMDWWLSA
jgi:hypothetical protein